MKKNISFLSKRFQFLEVKFSIYLNRRVFVMDLIAKSLEQIVKVVELYYDFTILKYIS